MKKVVFGLMTGISLVIAVLLFYCKPLPIFVRQEAVTPVRIGVTGSKAEIDSTLYMKGIQLALDEYRSSHNGQKTIELVVLDDQGDINTGLRVAQKFADDPLIRGVLGHWDSVIAIPASDIYEHAGLAMISPVVSNPKLYNAGKKNVFGIIPGDVYIAEMMAEYAKSRKYQRMSVYYSDNLYGSELSKAFCKSAEKRGIIIIDRNASFVNALEAELTIQKWKTLECQAIFIADGLPGAGAVIGAIRAQGLNIPILGDWGLDLSDVVAELGTDANNLVYPTLFDPNASRKQLQQFKRDFIRKFNQEPDLWAMLGYDAMKLMGYALDRAKSLSRQDIAEALRSVRNWPGVSYDMTFNSNGELIDPRIVIKRVASGRYVYER